MGQGRAKSAEWKGTNCHRERSQARSEQAAVMREAPELCLGPHWAGTWMPSCTAILGLHRTFPETEVHSGRCLETQPAREARSYFQLELMRQKKSVKQDSELSSVSKLLYPLGQTEEIWVCAIISHTSGNWSPPAWVPTRAREPASKVQALDQELNPWNPDSTFTSCIPSGIY